MKMRKIIDSIAIGVKRAIAPYEVCDTYKTRIFCWSLAEADSWIPYCSERMIVVDRFWGKIVRERIVMSGADMAQLDSVSEIGSYAWDSSVFDTIR